MKKTHALMAALVAAFSTSAALAQFDNFGGGGFSDPFNPANPNNLINPLSPYNVLDDDDDGAAAQRRAERRAAEQAAYEAEAARLRPLLRDAIADPASTSETIKNLLDGFEFSNFDSADWNFLEEARLEVLGTATPERVATPAEVSQMIEHMHDADFSRKAKIGWTVAGSVAGLVALLAGGAYLKGRLEETTYQRENMWSRDYN